MKINTIEYTKTFNLGNYSNERIGVVVDVTEGDDLLECFAEAKRTVEKSHKFFQDLPEYERAGQIINNPKDHTGWQVEHAEQTRQAFEANYPDYIRAFTPASRTLQQPEHDDVPQGYGAGAGIDYAAVEQRLNGFGEDTYK